MKRARKLALLTLRAVEYELQASVDGLFSLDTLVSAEYPWQIQQVLDELQLISAPNRIAGGPPENRVEVVSLRDHVLQLSDRRDLPASEQLLSPSERLRSP